MDPERFVLDPSVAAKWYLTEENERLAANQLFARLFGGSVRLSVPDLFFDELAHALVKASAAHAPRISKIEARAYFLQALGFPLDREVLLSADRERAFELATRHSKVYYDMVYLALAERLECNWLTADEKVLKSSGPNFPASRISLLADPAT